jgi:hypothetical protein
MPSDADVAVGENVGAQATAMDQPPADALSGESLRFSTGRSGPSGNATSSTTPFWELCRAPITPCG